MIEQLSEYTLIEIEFRYVIHTKTTCLVGITIIIQFHYSNRHTVAVNIKRHFY